MQWKVKLLVFIFWIALPLVTGAQAGELQMEPHEFKLQLIQKLSTAIDVNWPRSELINNDKVIDRPSYTWIPLISFQASDIAFENGGYLKRYCLFYRVPKLVNNKLVENGILRLGMTEDESCQKIIDSEVVELKNVNKFKIYFKGLDRDSVKVEVSQKKQLAYYHLMLAFEHQKKSESLEVPLYNSKNKNEISLLRRSVLLWGDVESYQGSHFLLGKDSDDYLEDKVTACQLFDKNCNEEISFRCDRCRQGWFEVISANQCPQGGNKYCGKDLCGQKGYPACLGGKSKPLCAPGFKAYLDGRQNYICL